MKKLYTLLIVMCASMTMVAQTVHITEIHYDNAGGDVGEFVEIFITNPQPSNLSAYQVDLYNGSSSQLKSYGSITVDNMTQSMNDDINGFGTGRYYTWFPSSIQNGAPDGVATSGPSGFIELLSYEGSFTPVSGPAAGQPSTDIGTSETSSTGSGTSMQNNGQGTWVSGLPDTPGANNNNDILPVEFTYFTAVKRFQVINITWQTATEINNDRFEIQRSYDANRFESIGKIHGEGHSQRLVDYSFVDDAPLSGINYYRLKQVDIDGAFEYSDVVSVEMDKSSKVRITPTSTFDFVTVNVGAESSIILRSINGQVMNSQSDTEGNFTVEMANYPQGIYYLTININGSLQTEKIVRL